MCFSATASFVAGAALSGTGAVTLRETSGQKEIPFAAIPLLFGMQQIIEGGVWLSFKYSLPFLNQVATYAFMLFAYVFWPTFIPYAIGLLETDPHRKKILYGFQVVGAAVSLSLLYFILLHPAVSQVVNKSITYTMPAATPYGALLVGLYLLATCASCLFSSHRLINIFGALAAISFAIAYYFYTASFVSVWCFFATILSGVVYLYFRKEK